MFPKPISIHAPAWGATCIAEIRIWVAEIFQSTLPHGERLLFFFYLLDTFHFNPRSRMGSDRPDFQQVSILQKISIHAPAWGATKKKEVLYG